jgi:hypothetical protein
MHLSGVLLVIGFGCIPAASAEAYARTFEIMAWSFAFHVAVQIPVGLTASRWAARGQLGRAVVIALGLATSVTWAFYLGTGQELPMPALWWQILGCLCVSLSSYVWLCTLRRSTVERLVGRFKAAAQMIAMWALLRPPWRGPH